MDTAARQRHPPVSSIQRHADADQQRQPEHPPRGREQESGKEQEIPQMWAEHVAHTVEDPRVDWRRILAHRQSQQQHRDYTHGRPPAHRPVDRHIPKVNYTREESTTDAVQAATTGRLTVAGPPPTRMTSRIGFAEASKDGFHSSADEIAAEIARRHRQPGRRGAVKRELQRRRLVEKLDQGTL